MSSTPDTPSERPGSPSERERAIDVVCMRIAYESMLSTGLATSVAATAVALILAREVPATRLAVWAGAAWAIGLLRSGLALRLRQRSRSDEEIRRFLPVFAGVMGLAAANWGVLILVAGLTTSAFVNGIIVLVICGMMAAGAQQIAMTPKVFRSSVLLSLAPISAHMILSGDGVLHGFFAMTVAHVLAMLSAVRRNNAAARDAIALRFENQELVRALRDEKAREASAREAAERASREKSRFLAAASHDVRQPLHALGLFIDALRARPLEADAARIVSSMDQAHASLASLHEGLLDVSRLDAGAIAPRLHDVRARDVVERAVLEASARAAEKGLVLRAAVADVALRTDAELLLRILRNLLANAISYTRAGRVMVAVRRRRGAALVQVWDTGIGIPESELGRIFDELHQIGNRARDREQGLGLGLAIVRRLGTLLGTEVRVRSTLGRGSVFELLVALAPSPVASDDAERAEPSRAMPEPTVAAGSLALVVDDDALAREAVASTLSRWGYEVVAASSAGEALEYARELARVDLLVTDLWLPDRPGLELAKELARPDLACVVTTGSTDPETDRAVRTSGLSLLHKPVRAAQLWDATRAAGSAARAPLSPR